MSEIPEAYAKMNTCPVCNLKPTIMYEQGCHFTECLRGEKCPCKCAVPDWDPAGLADLVNRKMDERGKIL
jgi:hypothetical protein